MSIYTKPETLIPYTETISCESISIRPGDIQITPVTLLHTQRLPHRLRRINNVVRTRRLVIMIRITPHGGVTLVHHHGPSCLPIPMNVDEVETPAFLVEPPRRQSNDRLVVGVELVVALGWCSPAAPCLEAVPRQGRLGAGGDRRGAFVGGVLLAGFAAVGFLALVALPRWRSDPCDVATRLAGLAVHVGRSEDENGGEEKNWGRGLAGDVHHCGCVFWSL
ncbi:unnamed protein product [Linum tenue]|uniref:Uncharacterized protein n=1 Tax=Linum tenue TaxID=586396 RepID=A0AAV0RM93_9ROSI|nr:unnamed protein product [Linum tenue]